MDTAASRPWRADNDRGHEIVVVCGMLSTITLVIVLLRLWVRGRMIRQLGWDDFAMIACLTVLFTDMLLVLMSVRYGAGRHIEYIVPASNIPRALHLNFANQSMCLAALCLAKVSAGLFLVRVTPSRPYRTFILCVIGFTVLSATGSTLTVLLQCRPMSFAWNTSIVGGSCLAPERLKVAVIWNSFVSVMTDLIFALLPIPILWHVQLNWKVKGAVAGILSLGFLYEPCQNPDMGRTLMILDSATLAGMVKISFLCRYGTHGDLLYDSTDITIWTTVEICAAMVAASVPCLKPLFSAMLASSSSIYGGGRTTCHQSCQRLHQQAPPTAMVRGARAVPIMGGAAPTRFERTYMHSSRPRTFCHASAAPDVPGRAASAAAAAAAADDDRARPCLEKGKVSCDGITKTFRVDVTIDDPNPCGSQRREGR